MPNEIKQLFAAASPLTITLASLASSTVGVGRQSTLIDNSTTRFGRLLVFVKVKQGTSPTGNRGAQVYLLRGDGTYRDDGAGSSDAALTVLGAQLIGMLPNKASPSSGDVLQGWFVVDEPGKEFGLAIVHDTGVALDSTAGNHLVHFIGINSEVQA